MGHGIKVEENGALVQFLKKIEKDCKDVEKKILTQSGKVIKGKVVDLLNAIKRKDKYVKDGYTHMADDVKVRLSKDEFGYSVVRISGGKKTGTKWHLVNDGTFRTPATHFMTNAIDSSESEIEAIIDNELGRRFDD